MTLFRPYLFTLCLFVVVCFLGCQTPKESSVPELSSIELLRGDLALCGNSDFGELSFALFCSSTSQEYFELGVSLLHSFEYAEAEKAFVKVIDEDPDCAMAYWGVTMSIFHSLWMQSDLRYLEKGSKLLQIAKGLPQTERERDYLDAIGIFYKDWESIDKQTRVLLYEQKMEAIYLKYQEDTEAAVFYALALRASADPSDMTYKKQKKSGEILESLFVDQPNHPGIAHYIIHTYDYPELAIMGLETARRYAKIAPASAHAQHMPSHIFTRLGLWDESVNTNVNSTSSAVCYSESVEAEGHWAQEVHAMDYLVYAYLQMANNKKAEEQNMYLQSFDKTFPVDHFAVAYASAAIPARIALENKDWSTAANMELPSLEFSWQNFPWEKAIMHFTRAMGSSRSGDIPSAERELLIIQSLHAELVTKGDEYKANQVQIQINIIESWIFFEQGSHNEAIAAMEKAVDLEGKTTKHPVTPGELFPAQELLGDLFLTMNKPAEALAAYEMNLKGHPNRFNGLYGAAVAAKATGDMERASLYFEMLLTLSENSDSNRPEIDEAKAFVDQQKTRGIV